MGNRVERLWLLRFLSMAENPSESRRRYSAHRNSQKKKKASVRRLEDFLNDSSSFCHEILNAVAKTLRNFPVQMLGAL